MARRSSACAPRATGPDRSLSTEFASPAPPSAICVCRVQQHPLPHRLAQEVHRELGVDEQVAAPVEHVGGAVAGVGDDHDALARARLLALDERDPHARPDRRRPAVLPAAVDPAPLDRVRVAERLAEHRRRRLRRLGQRRRAARAPCRRRARARATRGRAARAGRRRGPRPASSSTERPGRSTLVSTSSSAIGTAPRISTVTRASTMSSRGAVRSSAPVSSAEGGPAC